MKDLLPIETILLCMCTDLYSYGEYLKEIGDQGREYFTKNDNQQQKEWSNWFLNK